MGDMENGDSTGLEIFTNPFDIPRDKLLRNLMYLPVRVATALENRCKQVTGQRMRKMKTPLISILESRLASTQEELRESIPTKKGGLAAEELEERIDGVTDGCNKRKRVEEKFRENHSKKPLSGDNSSPRVPFLVTRLDTKEQTDFFISTIRVLRNVKPNQANELFDILSSPDLPVNKAHLVEQLIWMAKEYNKKALAEELMKYQSMGVPQAHT